MASMTLDNTDKPGGFSRIDVVYPFITLERDGLGVQISNSRTDTLRIAQIGNPQDPINNAYIGIKIFDTSGIEPVLLDSGTSATFSIYGSIYSFDFNPAAPAAVVAGKYFDLGVSNADDGSGGSASGWVFVSIEGDDGISPNGSEPDLNPIYVSGDSSASPWRKSWSKRTSRCNCAAFPAPPAR